MLPEKAVDRIAKREKDRINKIVDKKIAELQTQIEEELSSSVCVNWWWIEGWQAAIKSLEELKEAI